MTSVLVTGASGFIGSALLRALSDAGFAARGAYRAAPAAAPSQNVALVGEINSATDWSRALEGVESVVHLAGIAHAKASEADYQRVIRDGGIRLVEQARAAGVRRFVFISSIKAVADRTYGTPVDESAPPAPESPYGRAKLACERAVLAETGMAPVVLRPPLVVAPIAKASFGLLLKLSASGLPLPLAGLSVRRSIILREALVEGIKAVLKRPATTGVFHVATGPALTPGEMVRALRQGMGLPPRLFTAPGLGAMAPAALREEFMVDDGAFRQAFGYGDWRLDAEDGLRETGRAWKTGGR